MTRVVIVGEIYNADLYPGGGPMPGGGYPDQGLPGQQPGHVWWGGRHPPHVGGGPVYPGYPSGQPVPPGGPTDPGYGQGHPIGGYPGNWVPGSGNYPTGGPVPGGGYPDNTLPGTMPQGGTEVPEDVYTPTPPPEDISSQYIVSVYDPKTMTWTTKTYPPR